MFSNISDGLSELDLQSYYIGKVNIEIESIKKQDNSDYYNIYKNVLYIKLQKLLLKFHQFVRKYENLKDNNDDDLISSKSYISFSSNKSLKNQDYYKKELLLLDEEYTDIMLSCAAFIQIANNVNDYFMDDLFEIVTYLPVIYWLYNKFNNQ